MLCQLKILGLDSDLDENATLFLDTAKQEEGDSPEVDKENWRG